MRTTTKTSPSAGQSVDMEDVPDPRVREKDRRRTHTAKYKHDVLAEYEAGDTVADHIAVRSDAVTPVPSALRKKIPVRADGTRSA